MFGQNREKKRFSWRWAVLLVALVAGSLLLAACGDSDPTATPEPTPVQATPDKDDDAMMDEDGDAMMSLSDIDETTTGAELIASLSEGEADCLRAAIGDASYEAMQDLTLSESAMGFDTFPLQCLEPGNAIDLSVAMMSLQAGGLSDDSRACIKDVFADLGVPGEGMSMTDSMRSFITMQLCLTDEEAQAMSGPVPEEDAFPLPSQLRCVSEQTDLENLFIVYQAFADLESRTEQPTPSPEMTKAVAEIMAAQETCGIPTIIQGDEDGDAMMSLSDIDETTTGAELIASLSEGEADCLRAAIGDASYEAMQDLTLSESAMGFDTFPLQCLEPGNAIDLSVAMMSLQAGGLSDDSRACIKDVFADLGVPGEGMSMTDSMRSFITMQLCLTDEEAQAMSGPVPEEDAFPLPSQLRCVSEQTDLENLFIVYQAFADLESRTEQPTPSPEMTKAVAEIMAAQETCGIPTIIQGDEDGDAMMSLSDIDETTTGAELIASLSEGEADCLRAAIGDASYEAMQDLTLSESAMGFDTFPLQCLEPGNAIDLSVAMMSLQAGGLSDDSRACIKDVFADLGVPGEGMSMTDSMRSFITMQLCLTDEEAQAMSGPVPEEDAFPLPSQLRCVSEQTDLENLFIVYQAFADLESRTEQPTPSPEMTKAVAEIMAAQETCGIPTIIQGEGSAP